MIGQQHRLRFAPEHAGGAAGAARPVPGTPRPYHFPRFERRVLPNGLSVVVAPVHDLPIVTLHVLVDAGAAHDPRNGEGTAMLAAALLAEGTRSLDGATLADRFEGLGSAVEVGADWDSAWAECTGLTSRFDSFAALLADVVRHPAFDDREVTRARGERLAELLEQRAEPRGLADDMFARFAYAEGARYGMPSGGTEASVGGIGREALATFHSARYTPASTTLVVVGAVSVDEAERVVAAHFGSWQGAPRVTAPGIAPDTEAPGARVIDLVGKLDAPQSEIRVGHVAIPRPHPDWMRVHVMNAILGGLFSSRINLNLRERHAYTYGAFSSVDPRRHAGTFEVATAVQSDVTVPAVREILGEIERMTTAEVGADELTLATAYLDGVFPIRYETTTAIAGALANLSIFGLRDDYYDQYRAIVRGVTTVDVLAAARLVLRPAAARIVIVGDPAQLRPALAGLSLGEVREWDARGARIG